MMVVKCDNGDNDMIFEIRILLIMWKWLKKRKPCRCPPSNASLRLQSSDLKYIFFIFFRYWPWGLFLSQTDSLLELWALGQPYPGHMFWDSQRCRNSKIHLVLGQFGTRTIWHHGQFGTAHVGGQFGTMGKSGQFGTTDNLAPRTIWHRGQFGTRTIWHHG